MTARQNTTNLPVVFVENALKFNDFSYRQNCNTVKRM